MTKQKLQGRSGSNAGRGFRYQDAVAAWLAIQIWAGAGDAGIVVPEGGDDIERRQAAGISLIQVKSRRDHLGPLPVSDAVKFIKELWSRHGRISPSPIGLRLIVERGVVGLPADEHGDIAIRGGLAVALPSGAANDVLRVKTSVHHVPSPFSDSIKTIVTQKGCSPLAAEICFAQILAAVGTQADSNGRLTPDHYQGLSPTDTESIIVSTLAAVDHTAIEAAVREGACEPVDFVTPLNDPNFYLGVDVQPGHIAAGLVLSRPAARENVVHAFESRRAALVVGPSGSGKSAIMWDAAYALRHTVRWYRLIRADPRDIASIRQLLRTLRAATDSPVGFVLDDVGRRGAEGWDALARELATVPGALLLGSIREEDTFLLGERSRAIEVRAEPDENLAERLYEELKAKDSTKWAGWKEPWKKSQGLVLEYVYILTAGLRFEETLADQVAARARDPARAGEMATLRIASLAGASGAAIEANRLPTILKLNEEEISRGLRRLLDEHLVRETEPGLLKGLHQLRSAEILKQAHTAPPPTLETTFERTALAVPAVDLEPLVADGLVSLGLPAEFVCQALAARLASEPDIEALAASLRGLGSAFIANATRKWLSLPTAVALPRTQIGSAAMFGVSGIPLPALPNLAPVTAAAADLTAIKSDTAGDPRHALLSALPANLLEAITRTAPDAGSLDRLLSTMIGMPLNKVIRSTLAALGPSMLSGPLADVAGLLGTIAGLDRDLAITWVDQAGTDATLGRLEREIPWATAVKLETTADGVVAQCNYRMVSDVVQDDVHRDVVRICELLLDVIPSADIAESAALAPNGVVAGVSDFDLANKRIPRGNLPTASLPRWNKRWRDAIANQVATASYTEYLSRAVAMLDRLAPLLERTFDGILRYRRLPPACEFGLNALNAEAETLTPPKESPAAVSGAGSNEANTAVTKLQDLLFSSSVNVVKRFCSLPDGAGAYVGWLGDLIKQADAAATDEPWTIIGAGPPASLARVRQVLVTARLLAGEAHVRSESPTVTWDSSSRKARAGNALRLVGVLAASATNTRRAALLADLRAHVAETGLSIDIRVCEDSEAILPWPPTEVLALVRAPDVIDALSAMDQAASVVRGLINSTMRFTIVPVIGSYALSAFALTGHSTLLPVTDEAKILKKWDLTPFDMPATAAWDKATAFASGLESMDRLGLGAKDRPVAEAEARAALQGPFLQSLDTLRQLLEQVCPELVDGAMDTLNQVRSGDLGVADAAHSLLRGAEPPNLLELARYRILILQAEIDNQIRSRNA